MQYIELDGSTDWNFSLLIIGELNQRGFTTGAGNSRENKGNRGKRVSADIQERNFPCWKGLDRGHEKMGEEFLKKR